MPKKKVEPMFMGMKFTEGLSAVIVKNLTEVHLHSSEGVEKLCDATSPDAAQIIGRALADVHGILMSHDLTNAPADAKTITHD